MLKTFLSQEKYLKSGRHLRVRKRQRYQKRTKHAKATAASCSSVKPLRTNKRSSCSLIGQTEKLKRSAEQSTSLHSRTDAILLKNKADHSLDIRSELNKSITCL